LKESPRESKKKPIRIMDPEMNITSISGKIIIKKPAPIRPIPEDVKNHQGAKDVALFLPEFHNPIIYSS
jgi:hypothetical protein